MIGGLFSLPGILVVTKNTLEEHNWLWRNRKIKWTEIKEIRSENQGSAVTVIGPSRIRIVHSNVYPDHARFLMEIKKHCGDNLPSDFPEKPLSSPPAV